MGWRMRLGTTQSRTCGSTSISRRQAVAEARALDVEVAVEELKLLPERHLLRGRRVERQAQEVAEPRDHLVGRVRVGVDERGDGVQGVEEEVRVELHLQSLQLRLRGAQLALAVALVVVGGVADDDDDPVDQQLPVDVDEDDAGQVAPARTWRRCR